VNKKRLAQLNSQPIEVLLLRVKEKEAELDEMWSFVQSKQQQRWLWQAVDHVTGEVLAYVLNTREDKAFLDLLALLQPNGCQHFYTDGWGTYERQIDEEQHTIGKRYTQNTTAETFELSHSHQALGTEDNLFFARLS
jgi:insertion element IS1 protein InsB